MNELELVLQDYHGSQYDNRPDVRRMKTCLAKHKLACWVKLDYDWPVTIDWLMTLYPADQRMWQIVTVLDPQLEVVSHE